MPAIAAELASPTDAYRRAARRLRCRYAGRPRELHRSLKQLAVNTPPGTCPPPAGARIPVVATRSYPGFIQTGPAQRFADHLAGQMTPSVLRYSQRLELLRAARRFGVGRFEANLLIAAVLDRRRPHVVEPEAETEVTIATQLATFILIQATMLLGVWWTLLR